MLWKFQHKEFFYLFIVLAITILVIVANEIRRKKVISRLGEISMIQQLMPESSLEKKRLKFYSGFSHQYFLFLVCVIYKVVTNPKN